MNRWLFVAPRFSRKIIMLFTFAYLAMIASFLVMEAKPFESATSLDCVAGPKTDSASTQVATGTCSTVMVQICEVRIPAAPYIIIDPVKSVIPDRLENNAPAEASRVDLLSGVGWLPEDWTMRRYQVILARWILHPTWSGRT